MSTPYVSPESAEPVEPKVCAVPYVRPDWNMYFIGIALAVADRGDCSRRRVGAVLVRPDRSIASTGYNGTEPGGLSCLAGECPRAASGAMPLSSYDTGAGACIALHAESNCLAFARENTTGYTMYVTCQPCIGCLRTIKAHRLTRVVYPDTAEFKVVRLDF